MALVNGESSCPNEVIIRVLIIDDDEDDFFLTREMFTDIPASWFIVDWASTYDNARTMIAKKEHDVLLIDYQLGSHTGIELLEESRALGFDPVIIMLTGMEDRHIDLQAIRSGASDYVIKADLSSQGLDRTIRYALERKRLKSERDRLNAELVDSSRRVGMADVASSVLHNVGNVLNSVNISTVVVFNTIRQSSLSKVARTATMLKEHAHDLGTFLTQDPKGKLIPNYLETLGQHLDQEQRTLLQELETLMQNIDHIKQIISTQQSIAKAGGLLEPVVLPDLIKQALALGLSPNDREWLAVSRDEPELPPLVIDRHQILQILVNLVRNAKHAMKARPDTSHSLTIRVESSGDQERLIRISVTDTGIGISSEHLPRMFSQGFTTKKDGHGFGLHSAALAAQQMQGSLKVDSAGEGMGAVFTLEFPAVVELIPV